MSAICMAFFYLQLLINNAITMVRIDSMLSGQGDANLLVSDRQAEITLMSAICMAFLYQQLQINNAMTMAQIDSMFSSNL